ncbi:uncharacterized protein LOC122516692 [Polistes fuscatus]|uniref:uncharacterized protein LOC122516692 n=1 Tax=Polistes fuscatus TaxID=30207 RepID=UPI001CA848C3|nr:uncharacterized protein LOC122516692 [Polistes fuscatus]XP_043490658.1 uncharacterized protein LOC122516692 [Polistes fuscatus]
MNVIIQTGFEAIFHDILFQPQTIPKGKQLVMAGHVRDVKEFRQCGNSYLIKSKAHQTELIALADLAGITATPGVFRIAIELLAMEISPEDIYFLLKQICLKTPSEYSSTSKNLDTQPEEDENSEKS